ncbi:MAG: NAD(P)/FAD-dependent oxidoreductase [Cytophagales bacterium]|nr:NAD(P)/FAD-dependent oxidoreductase [Cytophagales bacterium]
MAQIIDLILPPHIAFAPEALQNYVFDQYAHLQPHDYVLLRRSIDARSREIKVNIKLKLLEKGEIHIPIQYTLPNTNVSAKPPVNIIGCGPAGMFAALKVIELGCKPVIFERGKTVKDRRRDLANITKHHTINPHSNYCFGEGGAGTYSDGKLYTRSHKRGDVERILEIFVAHGASPNILADAHPHIGTNKLPQIVENMRNTIINCGGEIHFDTHITDFDIKNNTIKSVISGTNEYAAKSTILASGHSARDIFYLLHQKNIQIEAKPFALGVRAEHPQSLIDSIQYHTHERGQYLPPASYSLVAQVPYDGAEKGVFSFCMCPGGIIAPCATAQGEVVVNGWSPSGRNNEYANSGVVVQVDASDWKSDSPLSALHFQEAVELKACTMAGNTQTAPAQRMADFVSGKVSNDIGSTSYLPGVVSSDLNMLLPPQISSRLREAFILFGKKMKGYYTNEAHLVAVESRTSSPVRIPRHAEKLHHVQINNLFPCGEGAGYAGGIVSAAMDGERCAVCAVLNE